MSIVNGPKIVTMVSAANGDTYGDGDRHQLRTQQALIQANVISIGVNAPPITPGSGNNGFTYVVGTTPTGAWSGQANAVAYSATDNQDGNTISPTIATGAWEFYTPLAGWRVFDNTSGAVWQFNGTAWVLASSLKIPVVAAATTTINPALGSSFRVAVGTAVTSVVFSNGVSDGQNIEVLWVQDGTGHSVTGFAGNIHGVGFLTAGSNTFAANPSATANLVSAQRYTWDSTLGFWFALSMGEAGM